MNLPPSCFFGVNEIGNKESTWSGLIYKSYIFSESLHTTTEHGNYVVA